MSVIESPKTATEELEYDEPVEDFEEFFSTVPEEAVLLERAADILENEGWCRYTLTSWGNRCALGGLGSARNRMFGRGKRAMKVYENAVEELARFLVDKGQDRTHHQPMAKITSWNDRQSPGKHGRKTVVRTMREAAARIVARS